MALTFCIPKKIWVAPNGLQTTLWEALADKTTKTFPSHPNGLSFLQAELIFYCWMLQSTLYITLLYEFSCSELLTCHIQKRASLTHSVPPGPTQYGTTTKICPVKHKINKCWLNE